MATTHSPAALSEPERTRAALPALREEHGLFDYGFKNNYESVFRADFDVPRYTTRQNVFGPVLGKCCGLGAGKRSEALASCRTLARENAYYLERLNAASACGELDGVRVVGEIPRPRDRPNPPIQSCLQTVQALEGSNVTVEKVTRVAEPVLEPGIREVLLLHHPGANHDPITIVKVPFPEGALDGSAEEMATGAPECHHWTYPPGRGRAPPEKLRPPQSRSSVFPDTIPRLTGDVERRHYRDDSKDILPAGLPYRMHGTDPITQTPRNGSYRSNHSFPGAAGEHIEPDKVTSLCPEHERLHYRYYEEFLPFAGKPAGRPISKDMPIDGFNQRSRGVAENGRLPEHVTDIISDLKRMPEATA